MRITGVVVLVFLLFTSIHSAPVEPTTATEEYSDDKKADDDDDDEMRKFETAVELEDIRDNERLRRYINMGLSVVNVERIQHISQLHPDAAPYVDINSVHQAMEDNPELAAVSDSIASPGGGKSRESNQENAVPMEGGK